MISEGLGEMSEGDSADTCAEKFPLVSIGGRAEGQVFADPGARTLIGASGILKMKIYGKQTILVHLIIIRYGLNIYVGVVA